MNGQIQYDGAPVMTSRPTDPASGRPRLADPRRFGIGTRTSRPAALMIAGSLIVCALLAGVPVRLPSLAVVAILGGAWLSFVLGVTLPSPPERAAAELARRLARFRDAVNEVGDNPTHADLERLLALSGELQLEEREVAEELAHVRAAMGALTLRQELLDGRLPLVSAPDPLPAGDCCHFRAPVRCGRRRSDQFGHLMLTTGWLKFRGGIDVSVTWGEVCSVQRAGADIIIGLQQSNRILRFSLQTMEDAARCGVIADFLRGVAAGEEAVPQTT